MKLRYIGDLPEQFTCKRDEHYETAGLVVVNGSLMVTIFIPEQVKWIIAGIENFTPVSFLEPIPEKPPVELLEKGE